MGKTVHKASAYQDALATSTPLPPQTLVVLNNLASKNVPLEPSFLLTLAAAATYPDATNLAITLASRLDLPEEVAKALACDARIAVRQAYLASPSRTIEEIRKIMSEETRPTALVKLLSDPHTPESVVQVLAERNSPLLAMKILERNTSPSNEIIVLALKTLEQSKRALTSLAQSKVRYLLAQDQELANQVASFTTKDEVIALLLHITLNVASFERLSNLVVFDQIKELSKLQTINPNHYSNPYTPIFQAARQLLDNPHLSPVLGRKIAEQVDEVVKTRNLNWGSYPAGMIKEQINKFLSFDTELLLTLPKLIPDDLQRVRTTDDQIYLQSFALAVTIVKTTSQQKSFAAAAAILENPNLTTSLQDQMLDYLDERQGIALLGQIWKTDYSVRQPLINKILKKYPLSISYAPEITPVLLQTLTTLWDDDQKHNLQGWSKLLDRKDTTRQTILLAPWNILSARSLSTKPHSPQNLPLEAITVSQCLSKSLDNNTKWQLFAQLQTSFPGNLTELLETVTSLAGTSSNS